MKLGAGAVLDDHRRLQHVAELAGDEARLRVRGATGGQAQDDPDRPSLVEERGRRGRCGGCEHGREGQDQRADCAAAVDATYGKTMRFHSLANPTCFTIAPQRS